MGVAMAYRKTFFFSCIFMFAASRVPLVAAEKLIADYGGHAGFQSAVWVGKDLKIFDKTASISK